MKEKLFTLFLILPCTGLSPWDFGSINSCFVLSKETPQYCRSVSIVPDHVHEDDEEFHVILSSCYYYYYYPLPKYVSLSPAETTIKIINIESKFFLYSSKHSCNFNFFFQTENFTLGFNLARIKVQENTGTVDICIISSINNFHNGRVTLQVVIPWCHGNGG